ncbi:T9SS type A sorting domain-containing protein [Winogradskyella sp.]|uniref:T9SS type A sorting domain-containing protein n=1 Tax=Winogradskyella sp. TaxID=1883156 RepID=UPI0026138C0D|nr:T9SS type A sorting domain-containing protein [Winogradskyella sp.]
MTVVSHGQSFSGNGNTGFGGLLGESSLDVNFNPSFDTFTTFLFSGGGVDGTFNANDKVVIYIDSDTSGDFTETDNFTDTGDDLRRAISGFDGFNRSAAQFPPGFEADYAIALDGNFCGLWQLVENGSHIFIDGANMDGIQNPNFYIDGADHFFEFFNADFGDPSTFKFLATFISNTAFRSDEAIGGIDDFFGNPGQGPANFIQYFTDDERVGGLGSTTSLATVWSFDGSWTNGNVPFDTDEIRINHDMIVDIDASVGEFIIRPSNTVTINPGQSLTVSGSATNDGDFTNDNGTLILNSTNTQYSSFIVLGSSSGSGTNTYNRHVNDNDIVNGNDLISAPVTGQTFDIFIGNNTNILANPNGNDVLFGGFDSDNAANPFELWDEADTTPLNPGTGYRTGVDPVAASNLVSFEGTVNTSLVQVPIAQGTASILNLIGNPFPSYIDAQAFLTRNATVLDPSAQVIYGYNDSTDGTSADDYTIIGLLPPNNTLNIAPGQGFFVASNTTGGNIEFTTSSPDMRIVSTQDDFISGRNAASSSITNLKLDLRNATDNFRTDIFFTEFSGLGLDPGYDATLLGSVAPAFSLFSHLVQENMGLPFAIQALGQIDYNDVTIPIGVNAAQGEQLTFSIIDNTLPASVDVYLDDTETSSSTLLNLGDYIITPTSDLNGIGRFFLRFTNSALSTPENDLSELTIYTNQENKTINVSGRITENTMVNIYDLQGRLVKSAVLNTTSTLQVIDANNLYTGIYLVQLSNTSNTMSEKVILK